MPAARAIRGRLHLLRPQRRGNGELHALHARRLAGSALPRPLQAQECTRSQEETQPGELTRDGQMDFTYHVLLSLAVKVGVSDLKKKYNITAIPKLVIVKQTGEVITDKGRKQIRDKGLSCFRNWLEGADIFQNFSS